MKPLTFEEGEALALWLDRKADREDAAAHHGLTPEARARARREAEQFRRVVELLGWLAQRADRLHELEIPKPAFERRRA